MWDAGAHIKKRSHLLFRLDMLSAWTLPPVELEARGISMQTGHVYTYICICMYIRVNVFARVLRHPNMYVCIYIYIRCAKNIMQYVDVAQKIALSGHWRTEPYACCEVGSA